MSILRYPSGAFMIVGVIVQAATLYQDAFEGDGLASNSGIGGGAINHTIQGHSWVDDGDATFVTDGTIYTRRAILYSENVFQSDTGFRLTVSYMTGNLGDLAAHNLSFGLVRSDTDLSSYDGFNPFREDTSVYSIGVNLTEDGGVATQGLNFTDGSAVTTLDQSGTQVQFEAGKQSEVTIEIGIGGYWCYRINGVYEASGVLLEGFDLSQDYHVVVYGQDDQGGGKSIQSIQLETAPAAGERAAKLRGGWNGGEGDLASVKDFKTLDSIGVRFSDGATQSAQHFAPHKLLETVALEGVDGAGPAIDYIIADSWGNLSLDAPEYDALLEEIFAIRAAGFKVKAYTNSENFVGSNAETLQEFVDRWMEYCDADAEMQAFINSKPYHTGVWNRTTQQYEDATETYPYRKYMFCYAEYVLKDYSLRYGQYMDSWIFDDGGTMGDNGDNTTSGILEEQRIYQAFAHAVYAGNPDCPIAFNNGRSTVNYASSPFAHAVRFDDFTFGHAFGGNNDHASKTGTQFNNNYRHITRMIETDGYVHDGGAWDWDNLVVGNFHSKLSTTAWKYGTNQAWEEADFFQWNIEALQAGGHMTWGGSVWRTNPTLQSWAYDLLKALDDYLAEFQSPGPPNWARAYTPLPDGVIGEPYEHVLVEELDLWDPEGDEIVSITAIGEDVAWLSISEDPDNVGQWIMSGVPAAYSARELTFSLQAMDVNGQSGSRDVELKLNGLPVATPMSTQTVPNVPVAVTLSGYGADRLTYSVQTTPTHGTLSGALPNVIYTPDSDYIGYDSFTYLVNDEEADSESVAVMIAVGVVPGLIAAWDLDDAAGAVIADSSGNTHHATLLDGSWVSGLEEGALDFNGIDGSVELPVAAFADLRNEVTVTMWIYGGLAQPAKDTLLSANDAAGNRVLNIHLPWSNSRVFWDAGTHGGTNYDRIEKVATSAEITGRWNHWVFIKDATRGEMMVYLNGALWNRGTDKARSMEGIASVFLGSQDGERFYDGMIDEVKLYNVALSSDEVSELYESYEGYDSWLSQYIELDDLDMESDPDGDRLPTILEYVLDGNPTVSSILGFPTIEQGVDGWTFRFTRRAESADDTNQILQVSTDLVDWQDIYLTGIVGPEVSLGPEMKGRQEVVVTVGEDLAENGQVFLRLKVSDESAP